MTILSGFYSAFRDINKVGGRDGDEDSQVGVSSTLLPELTLDMDNDALLKLTETWERKWNDSKIKKDWEKMVEENEKYWKGQQFHALETQALRPLVDNMVFEAMETYLPMATRQNPEPLVELRATEPQTPENIKYGEIVRNRLSDWSQDVSLRLKVKKAGRHWLLSLLGVGKMGWDLTHDRPSIKILRPKRMILDPDAISDEEGYSGEYAGEYRKLKASILIKMLEGEPADADGKTPAQIIQELAKGEMGTKIGFIEWWTPEYMCWIVPHHVLLKKKNPHWNYDQEPPTEITQPPTMPEGATSVSDTHQMPDGSMMPNSEMPTNPLPELNTATAMPAIPDNVPTPAAPAPIPGQNHFLAPKIPYVFLTIFNLGKSPVDETSLITQMLPQQDLTNKRLKQIDKNADTMNNGLVISEERSGLTKEEAKQVTEALRKGGTVTIPSGSPQDAVWKVPSNPLPPDVFNQLVDTRNRVYDLFGIRGITPAGVKNEDTVRGKIIVRGLDTDRIGGGISEYFEQFAGEVYNWVVQLYYVYDDIFAKYRDAQLPKIKVSVKEGSLLPKDATTRANQAIELASQGKMALVDLYKALEYPDPEDMAARVWVEATMPFMLFPNNKMVQQVMQMMAQNAKGEDKPPSESISFKDLPPEGKVQMAKQAGIDINPQQVEAEEAKQDEREAKKKADEISLKQANKNDNAISK